MPSHAPTAEKADPQVDPEVPVAARHVLTKAEIFGADDIVVEWQDVPDWGGGVYVRSLTGAQRDSFEKLMVEQRGNNRVMNVTNFRAKLIARSVVDGPDPKTAKLLFTDQDVEQLARKSARPLQLIYDKAAQLSGFSTAEVDTLTVELGNAQSDGSGSD